MIKGQKRQCTVCIVSFFFLSRFDKIRDSNCDRMRKKQEKEKKGNSKMASVEPITAVFSDGCLTVTVAGDIDHHSARALREGLDRQLYLYHPHDFVLSLGQVNFMDSSGLGLILGRLAVCRHFSCTMHLTDVSERMLRIFKLAGLWRIPDLHIDGLAKEECET